MFNLFILLDFIAKIISQTNFIKSFELISEIDVTIGRHSDKFVKT